MIKRITLNGRVVEYDLQRKSVKNINLRIKPDGSVHLSASPRVTMERIEAFLTSRADTITRVLARCDELIKNAPRPKGYADGEMLRVLGCDVRLRVVRGVKNSAEFDGTTVTLTVKDVSDTTLKQKTLQKWMDTLCRDTVDALCRRIYPAFEKLGVEYPEIKYRHMTSRWGSCHPTRGRLTFNYELVHAPVSCIEYVVMHEFTHFLVPDHSKSFYARLSSFMPDWEARRQLLRDVGVIVR